MSHTYYGANKNIIFICNGDFSGDVIIRRMEKRAKRVAGKPNEVVKQQVQVSCEHIFDYVFGYNGYREWIMEKPITNDDGKIIAMVAEHPGGTSFIRSGQMMAGPVCVKDTFGRGDYVDVEFADLVEFVAASVRSRRIARLEQMDAWDVLDLRRPTHHKG